MSHPKRSTARCTGFESTLGWSRRGFLSRFGLGVGAFALSDMLGRETTFASTRPDDLATGGSGGVMDQLHHEARAKRVIFLFQSGGPSQIDLLDYKPHLKKSSWSTTSGFRSKRPATDRNEWQPGQFAVGQFPIQIFAARQVRTMDQRTAAAHFKNC